MIDLHTHILWDWDDGPDDLYQTRAMCRMAAKDGTHTICLTPHIFRMTRHKDDLGVLRRRMVRVRRGDADVAGSAPRSSSTGGPRSSSTPRSSGPSRSTGSPSTRRATSFLEFASEGVPVGAANVLAQLMSKGFVPIISHPERNRGFAARPELLFEFVSMGCAAQVTAASLTGELGKEVRTTAGLFMSHNLVHIIASDAHRAIGRPPGLSRAVEAAAKIVGESKARAMVTEIPRAILDNKALPDWGEPENPAQAEDLDAEAAGHAETCLPGGLSGRRRAPTTVLKIK
ncbi:MAG: hypothetical protein M0C28_41700 [Candidatus Moduliflexus flocculans]|nr:hypothetical protein [Candidatus Moduliflexus flocculans]